MIKFLVDLRFWIASPLERGATPSAFDVASSPAAPQQSSQAHHTLAARWRSLHKSIRSVINAPLWQKAASPARLSLFLSLPVQPCRQVLCRWTAASAFLIGGSSSMPNILSVLWWFCVLFFLNNSHKKKLYCPKEKKNPQPRNKENKRVKHDWLFFFKLVLMISGEEDWKELFFTEESLTSHGYSTKNWWNPPDFWRYGQTQCSEWTNDEVPIYRKASQIHNIHIVGRREEKLIQSYSFPSSTTRYSRKW